MLTTRQWLDSWGNMDSAEKIKHIVSDRQLQNVYVTTSVVSIINSYLDDKKAQNLVTSYFSMDCTPPLLPQYPLAKVFSYLNIDEHMRALSLSSYFLAAGSTKASWCPVAFDNPGKYLMVDKMQQLKIRYNLPVAFAIRSYEGQKLIFGIKNDEKKIDYSKKLEVLDLSKDPSTRVRFRTENGIERSYEEKVYKTLFGKFQSEYQVLISLNTTFDKLHTLQLNPRVTHNEVEAVALFSNLHYFPSLTNLATQVTDKSPHPLSESCLLLQKQLKQLTLYVKMETKTLALPEQCSFPKLEMLQLEAVDSERRELTPKKVTLAAPLKHDELSKWLAFSRFPKLISLRALGVFTFNQKFVDREFLDEQLRQQLTTLVLGDCFRGLLSSTDANPWQFEGRSFPKLSRVAFWNCYTLTSVNIQNLVTHCKNLEWLDIRSHKASHLQPNAGNPWNPPVITKAELRLKNKNLRRLYAELPPLYAELPPLHAELPPPNMLGAVKIDQYDQFDEDQLSEDTRLPKLRELKPEWLKKGRLTGIDRAGGKQFYSGELKLPEWKKPITVKVTQFFDTAALEYQQERDSTAIIVNKPGMEKYHTTIYGCIHSQRQIVSSDNSITPEKLFEEHKAVTGAASSAAKLVSSAKSFPPLLRLRLGLDAIRWVLTMARKTSAGRYGYVEPFLIHRHLKPSNVLLNPDYKNIMSQPIDLDNLENLPPISAIDNSGTGTVKSKSLKAGATYSPDAAPGAEDDNPAYDDKVSMWNFGKLMFEYWLITPWDKFTSEDQERVIMKRFKPKENQEMAALYNGLWMSQPKDGGVPALIYDGVEIGCWEKSPCDRPPAEALLRYVVDTIKEVLLKEDNESKEKFDKEEKEKCSKDPAYKARTYVSGLFKSKKTLEEMEGAAVVQKPGENKVTSTLVPPSPLPQVPLGSSLPQETKALAGQEGHVKPLISNAPPVSLGSLSLTSFRPAETKVLVGPKASMEAPKSAPAGVESKMGVVASINTQSPKATPTSGSDNPMPRMVNIVEADAWERIKAVAQKVSGEVLPAAALRKR